MGREEAEGPTLDRDVGARPAPGDEDSQVEQRDTGQELALRPIGRRQLAIGLVATNQDEVLVGEPDDGRRRGGQASLERRVRHRHRVREAPLGQSGEQQGLEVVGDDEAEVGAGLVEDLPCGDLLQTDHVRTLLGEEVGDGVGPLGVVRLDHALVDGVGGGHQLRRIGEGEEWRQVGAEVDVVRGDGDVGGGVLAEGCRPGGRRRRDTQAQAQGQGDQNRDRHHSASDSLRHFVSHRRRTEDRHETCRDDRTDRPGQRDAGPAGGAAGPASPIAVLPSRRARGRPGCRTTPSRSRRRRARREIGMSNGDRWCPSGHSASPFRPPVGETGTDVRTEPSSVVLPSTARGLASVASAASGASIVAAVVKPASRNGTLLRLIASSIRHRVAKSTRRMEEQGQRPDLTLFRMASSLASGANRPRARGRRWRRRKRPCPGARRCGRR